ncbi:MAG: hypothetical protein ACLU4J_24770 [Butyricimonas paravirosa]
MSDSLLERASRRLSIRKLSSTRGRRGSEILPVSLALSRGGEREKIMIFGDAVFEDGEPCNRSPLWTAYVLIQGGFFWLSDGEVPIDVRRPYPIDRKLFVGETGAEVLNYALLGGFPGLLLFLSLFIWLKRRGR